LKTFWVFRNKLTGTIPTEIGLWTDTIAFIADHNMFTGTIPTEIASWTYLEGFRVNDNNLEGSLPSAITQWTDLEVFRVDNNPLLAGSIPPIGSNWTRLVRAEFIILA